MSRPTRILLRIVVVGAVALAALIGTIAIYDGLTATTPTYEPIVAPTALDGWRPGWSQDEPVADDTESPVEGEIPAEKEVTSCSTLPEKWLMIDWDAAEWEIILPLLESGDLPNLEALMRSGSYGNLDSFLPSISPAIWTTIATGLSPDEHGIRHFYNQQPRLARWWNRLTHFGQLERHLYSNADRRAPAVWNVLSDLGEPVMIMGYHNTFPVEEVEGLIVSNYLNQDSVADLMQMDASGDEAGFATALVHPHEYLEPVLEIQQTVQSEMPTAVQELATFADDDQLRRFLQTARQLDQEGDQRPYFLSRAWIYDEIVARATERFYQDFAPKLAIVHFQSLDWAAHHFLYFDQPEGYTEFAWDDAQRATLEDQQALYADTVTAFYRNADAWLGRLLELKDDSTGVILLSDHGTGPGPDPDLPGYHDDGPPGILVMSGPGIRAGHRIEDASIYDILPTLMAGIGAPVAEDLPGRTLEEAFCPQAWETRSGAMVASYRRDEQFVPPISRPDALSDDLMKQLESLGYLD